MHGKASSERVLKLLEHGFEALKILVVGDLMLDHYVWGKVERISPEAPVPVLEASREEYRLGGAANVALNLKSLGASVDCVGICGKDFAGERLCAMLAEQGIGMGQIVTDSRRKTTLKTRMASGTQQIIRIDYEDSSDLDPDQEETVYQAVVAALEGVDALILEDYNKGLLTQGLIGRIIRLCRDRGLPVAVDPKRRNFMAYKDVSILKPNYSELCSVMNLGQPTEEDYRKAAVELLGKLEPRYLVVTRGARGLEIYSRETGDQALRIPTFAREVFDVTGAGDTVIACLSLALAAGAEIGDAAILANHAAGVVCGKVGTAKASPSEIMESIKAYETAASADETGLIQE